MMKTFKEMTAAADDFKKISLKMGILAEIVTIGTTVDYDDYESRQVFAGKNLKIHALSGVDLIKSKIERYRKQDPDDIRRILEKTSLPIEAFIHMAGEMLLDYVGNSSVLRTTLEIIVEEQYGKSGLAIFKKTID